ncbi:MAG: lytic transglycosylase domain-containing protein [Bacteroidota bacterium]
MSNYYKRVFFAGLLLAMTFNPIPVDANTQSKQASNTAETYTSRLTQLQLPALATSSSRLNRKIDQYIKRGGRSTELMLARMELYFPIFERHLLASGMPVALKYLPVAESGLRSRAISPASAAGLWQLMPQTARQYGLRINRVVDERMDANLATEAALRMLNELYAEFGDWNLVLAAYNCGPYRVKKAITRARSTRYEDIKPYLPSETRQYLDAYTAAAYASEFATAHGYEARYSAWNAADLTEIVVYNYLSLREAANLAGINYRDFRRLNPSFLRGYVPENEKGYRLIIPRSSYYAIGRKIWNRENFVESVRHEETQRAIEIAGAQGFDAYRLLMGISTEILSKYNDLSFAAHQADELVINTFADLTDTETTP